jgi:hypothetical protein
MSFFSANLAFYIATSKGDLACRVCAYIGDILPRCGANDAGVLLYDEVAHGLELFVHGIKLIVFHCSQQIIIYYISISIVLTLASDIEKTVLIGH